MGRENIHFQMESIIEENSTKTLVLLCYKGLYILEDNGYLISTDGVLDVRIA